MRNFIGLGVSRPDLKPDSTEAAVATEGDVNALTAEAVASRPDVLAAQHAIAAADARIKLADLGWLRFLGIADATSGKNGHEFGPAFRATLPIFNWNQGAIAPLERVSTLSSNPHRRHVVRPIARCPASPRAYSSLDEPFSKTSP